MSVFEGHVGYEPAPITQMFHPKFRPMDAALGTPKGGGGGKGGLGGLVMPPRRPNIGDLVGGKPKA